MVQIALDSRQMTFILRLLNPTADIREIDASVNCGENMLFSKIPGDKLILPFGYHYTTKEGITNKWDNEYTLEEYYTTCKVYSHERAKSMGKLLEPKQRVIGNRKEDLKIKKVYIYSEYDNKKKTKKALVCYINKSAQGYKIVDYKDFWDVLVELEKQSKRKIGVKEILKDERISTNTPKAAIDRIIRSVVPFDIDDFLQGKSTYFNFRPKAANILSNNYVVVKSKSLMGKKKTVNTDSSLILSHPLNNNIKLLAVADSDENELNLVAATAATEALKDWFNKEKIDTLDNQDEVINRLKEKIYNINCTLYNIGYKNKATNDIATTLSVAMILKNITVVASIGSSMIYKVKDGELMPLKDKIQSLEKPINKENYSKLGRYDAYNIYIDSIPNDSYDKLLLLTDGVTYSLADSDIKSIVNKTRKSDIANELVDNAIGNYDDDTNYGSDNATAVVYIKK